MAFITFMAEFLGILLFFISIFVLFRRKDYRAIVQIISGSIFGITLEFMNVFLMSTYTYSTSFFLQLNAPPDNIPIVIGLCWGLIIFACMRVSNNVNNIPANQRFSALQDRICLASVCRTNRMCRSRIFLSLVHHSLHLL